MKTNGVQRVLGIDPGTGRMGWAILEGNNTRQELIACGCEETDKFLSPGERLVQLMVKLESLVAEYQPTAASVEEIFFFKNAKTIIRVSESRGVVVSTLVRAKVPVYDYTPLQVKQSVSGYGRADKNQVQQMVKVILKLKAVPKPDDAADACAVALTHLFTNQLLK